LHGGAARGRGGATGSAEGTGQPVGGWSGVGGAGDADADDQERRSGDFDQQFHGTVLLDPLRPVPTVTSKSGRAEATGSARSLHKFIGKVPRTATVRWFSLQCRARILCVIPTGMKRLVRPASPALPGPRSADRRAA